MEMPHYYIHHCHYNWKTIYILRTYFDKIQQNSWTNWTAMKNSEQPHQTFIFINRTKTRCKRRKSHRKWVGKACWLLIKTFQIYGIISSLNIRGQYTPRNVAVTSRHPHLRHISCSHKCTGSVYCPLHILCPLKER